MAASSRYSDIPHYIQKARCVFTTMAMSKALLALPETLDGSKKDQSALERTSRWHSKICEDLGKSGTLPKASDLAINAKLKKFNLAIGRCDKALRLAAGFWATTLLVCDVRVTCPAFGRSAAWRYLDLAADQFGRFLLALSDGADVAGDNIYLEIAW